MAKRSKSVMGVDAPGPRLTQGAIWLAVRLVGLPLLLVLLLLDVAIWWLADTIWNVCIGVWCGF